MRKKSGLGTAKKELDAQLNLTPFIDLLSTCVCFLLITAVWIEIGTVEIKQSHGTEASPSKEISYDLDVVYTSPTLANLNLKRNGKAVQRIEVKGESEEAFTTNLDALIKNKILSFKNQIITISTATVTPRSNVNYGSLVTTLDTLRKNNIMNIGILSAR